MTGDIAIRALTVAWFRNKPAPGVIHHPDKGSQAASHAFQSRMKEYGMACSMSSMGKILDNAPTEGLSKILKNERAHHTRHRTPATVRGPTRKATFSTTSNLSTTGAVDTPRATSPSQ